MNVDALFSDTTKYYCNPECPSPGDKVCIKLRVHKDDGLKVFLRTKGLYIPMERVGDKGCFSFYEVSIKLTHELFSYIFEVCEGDEIIYYDCVGINHEERFENSFRIMPGFDVPRWAKGAVMYQILTDRFAKGDCKNDVLSGEYYYIDRYSKKVENWSELPEDYDVHRFYGGDLAGVRDKLLYLKNLGVEVIYFNPLFVSPSNHKYDTQDYDYIDPHLTVIKNDSDVILTNNDKNNENALTYIKRTTDKENLEASNEYFAKFVEYAHELGIKVIIDGVFNHCGSFNKWLDKEGIYKNESNNAGAYLDENSPYRNYFSFREDGEYEGWWEHDTLPKLNYEDSPELVKQIMRIGAKWLLPPYNADGWRLDVAADLGHSEEYNHIFWKLFRKTVKSVKKDALILAEHYGDATPWLMGDEWDSIMNYDAFMDPISYFLTGMEKHSDDYKSELVGNASRFREAILNASKSMMMPSLLCSMNQLSNHDHSRFLTRTNKKVGRVSTLGSKAAKEDIDFAVFRQAILMQLTWVGAPTLYYGDEAGVVGFTDPDSRRTYPWGDENFDILDYYRDCISVRKHSTALKVGSTIFLLCEDGLLCYARFTDSETVVVAVNTKDSERECSIPVWRAGVPKGGVLNRIMVSNKRGYSILPKEYEEEDGMIDVLMEAKCACAYKWEEKYGSTR